MGFARRLSGRRHGIGDGTTAGQFDQVELARRLGKPQSMISAIEAGTQRVDVVEFLLIARTLGVDPVEIFAEIVKSLPEKR